MKTLPQVRPAILLLAILSYFDILAQTPDLKGPLLNETPIFKEVEGLLAVEAEHFYKQSKTEQRQWYRISKNESPRISRDDDESHCHGASNHTYLEILPDTRVSHGDTLIRGENFSNEGGKIGVLHYKVFFDNPGRYYVWVRAFSTGSEDNGLHVGINGTWPISGQRMQWCEGKNKWTWESKQRTKDEHCGVAKSIYLDITKRGDHDILFSMREDGFEFDKFILTKDINYVPKALGPKSVITEGLLPEAPAPCRSEKSKTSYFRTIATSNPNNTYIAAQEFPIEHSNFYKHGKNWLAINPETHKEATTSCSFKFESGIYDVIFVGVGENDGKSIFTIAINDSELGSYAPPLTEHLFEEGKAFNALWKNIEIKNGDQIYIKAEVATDGTEWTRGRWAGIIFAPVGEGNKIQDAPSSYSAN